MIFILLFFLAIGLALTVGPALALGLAVALIGASLRTPTRIALLVAVAAGLSLVWTALLHGSYLLLLVVVLVVLATAASGAAGMAWTARRASRRLTAAASPAMGGYPYWATNLPRSQG